MRRWMIAGVAVAFLVAAWAWRAREDGVETTKPAPDSDVIGADSTTPTASGPPVAARSDVSHPSASAPSPPKSPAPLPPEDTPLAEAYDALAARARGGDNAAAMRLARDLQRCHLTKYSAIALDLAVDRLAQGKPDSAVPRELEHMNSRLVETRELCDGIDRAHVEARGAWILLAAMRGDAQAMVCFAAHPDDFGPEFLSDAWFEWSQRWREHAPALVEEAYRRGQLDVLTLLADAYSGESHEGLPLAMTPLQGLVAPDPARAAAYAGIARRAGLAGDGFVQHFRERLDAAGLRRAHAIIARDALRFTSQRHSLRSGLPCQRTIRGEQ
ncbi:MAG: hypothetical protein J0L88_06765 [Xanthomonadales bacterium]|nr:hypothetical protein [Xanthomonadales bacterium]